LLLLIFQIETEVPKVANNWLKYKLKAHCLLKCSQDAIESKLEGHNQDKGEGHPCKCQGYSMVSKNRTENVVNDSNIDGKAEESGNSRKEVNSRENISCKRKECDSGGETCYSGVTKKRVLSSERSCPSDSCDMCPKVVSPSVLEERQAVCNVDRDVNHDSTGSSEERQAVCNVDRDVNHDSTGSNECPRTVDVEKKKSEVNEKKSTRETLNAAKHGHSVDCSPCVSGKAVDTGNTAVKYQCLQNFGVNMRQGVISQDTDSHRPCLPLHHFLELNYLQSEEFKDYLVKEKDFKRFCIMDIVPPCSTKCTCFTKRSSISIQYNFILFERI